MRYRLLSEVLYLILQTVHNRPIFFNFLLYVIIVRIYLESDGGMHFKGE